MKIDLIISPSAVTALVVFYLIARISTIVIILLQTHSAAKAMAYNPCSY